MTIFNILYRLIYFDYKKYISHHHITKNKIYSCILFNDQIYYSHNLELLDNYYNKNVFVSLNELSHKYNNIKFISYHISNKKNIKKSIYEIYILYDNDDKIVEFIGIDSRNTHFINL